MWYVVQVQTGKEEEVVYTLRKYIAQEYLKECFIPKYEGKKRYQGSWHMQLTPLFPGYVFMISDKIEQLYQMLKTIPQFAKILGTGEKWTALTEEETELIRRFTGEKRQMDLSRGYINKEQIVITEGPLKGMEGLIQKIDRHKRMAKVKVFMLGGIREIEVGLEIVRKE